VRTPYCQDKSYEGFIEYDFYGKVVSVDQTSLIVSTKHGIQTFVMDKNTVKGSDFEPGALVHVYYRRLGNRMSQR
jgi:hypothetical protein